MGGSGKGKQRPPLFFSSENRVGGEDRLHLSWLGGDRLHWKDDSSISPTDKEQQVPFKIIGASNCSKLSAAFVGLSKVYSDP